MARKKEMIDFRNKNITYNQEGVEYKVLSLKKTNMTVELSCIQKEKNLQNKIIPFAHLPKAIKTLVKPN